jgi:hypothetical protein
MASSSERNQKPEQTPSDEQTPVESKKQFKMPPGAVDVTSERLGRGYVIGTASPLGSRSTRSKDLGQP